MIHEPLLICLPVADRVRAFCFYREALGLEAVGEVADDGVPEPLVFVVNAGTRLMLIPTGGFGWVVGANEVAPSGSSECVLGLNAADEAAVDDAMGRALAAGATSVSAPGQQPWGYEGTFSDPDGHLWTVTSVPLPG